MTGTSTFRAASAPTTLNGLGQLLPRAAARFGDRVALVTDARTLTFAQLDHLSTLVAVGLSERGVEPGDRVSLLGQNRWEWIVAYHGALKLGAVVVPLNVMLTGIEVSYVLRDAGSTVLIASAERLEAVSADLAEVKTLDLVISFDQGPAGSMPLNALLGGEADPAFRPFDVDPDGLACIAYTSGTTGHPKGAMQSHRSLVLNCAYTATMHARSADEVVLTALPAPHVYGNVAINSTFMVGGRVVLMSRFDPEQALRAIGEHRATLLEGVPAMYAMMLAHPALADADFSSLRRSTVGGQTISTATIDRWEARSGAPLVELWGMTELSGLGTTHSVHAPAEHGSIGVSLPGVDVAVWRPEQPGTECGPGEAGELMVRGPIVTLGYYNNAEATAAAITDDGWLHTGDIATHNGRGHFFVVDRLKDVIFTGGYNVYPAEIERVLTTHPSVAMVAVGREPDEVKGEVAHAYVVLVPGAAPDVDALIAHCRAELAAYKVPKAVHFVSDLPTTSSGKLMRRMLRADTVQTTS